MHYEASFNYVLSKVHRPIQESVKNSPLAS